MPSQLREAIRTALNRLHDDFYLSWPEISNGIESFGGPRIPHGTLWSIAKGERWPEKWADFWGEVQDRRVHRPGWLLSYTDEEIIYMLENRR